MRYEVILNPLCQQELRELPSSVLSVFELNRHHETSSDFNRVFLLECATAWNSLRLG